MLEYGQHEIDLTKQLGQRALKNEDDTEDGPLIEDEEEHQARLLREEASRGEDYEAQAIN